VPKIVSERCVLVKLCDINRSGPFYLRHMSALNESLLVQLGV